jgi:PAS domain S-box-containing protein
MGEGLIKTDKDFKITFGNGAFCNMIGKAQNKINGMTPFDFISENEAQFLAIRLKRFDNGNESFELNLIHENGNTVPVLVTPRAFYTPEGELNGVVIVITEITKQKSTELALKESEKKLQEALSVKDKFFSIIAHDMKGPMGNFLGLSKVLNKDIEEMTMKDLKETASSIYDSANSIYKLLEDLLQWSRTQMGNISFNPEPIDLQELAFNNIYLLSASAKEKMIDLSSKIKSPVYVHGDRNMLTTVIRNLTSNAIKFTEEGGKITFDIVSEDSEFVTVCIEDTGIGMEEEVASNLFNPEHHHTSLGTNAEKGTGLGLVLCKEFVQKHGGRIWVRSQINIGSKFYFTVPKYRGDLAI